MNTKYSAFFFCALLASTFVHETIARHALVPYQPKIAQDFGEAENRISSLLKTGTTQNYQAAAFNYGAAYSQLVIVNTAVNTAAAFELQSNTCGFWNGADGTAILIDITNQIYVRISTGGWNAASQTFQQYFNSVVSIRALISAGVAIAISAAVSADQTLLVNIIQTLSISLYAQVSANFSLVFGVVVIFATNLLGLLNGSLNGILQFISSTLLTISGDLTFLYNVCLGLQVIFNAYVGGLSALIAKGFTIQLSLVFAAADGLRGLVIILTSLRLVEKLSAFASVLGDIKAFLNLIVLIGGGVILGVTGVVCVISNIIAAIDSKVSLATAIQVLVNFCANAYIVSQTGLSVIAGFQLILNIFIANSVLDINSSKLTVVQAFITTIVGGVCYYGLVSISGIINILVGVISNVVGTILSVINLLFVQFGNVLCVSTTLLSIILLLSTNVGAICLNTALNLGLDTAAIWASTNVLATVVGDVTQALAQLQILAQNAQTTVANLALSIKIPKINVLNIIYSLLSSAVSSYGLSLDTCVDAGNSADVQINVICNTVLGVNPY